MTVQWENGLGVKTEGSARKGLGLGENQDCWKGGRGKDKDKVKGKNKQGQEKGGRISGRLLPASSAARRA